jgi:parallel beta-helix repeat protein
MKSKRGEIGLIIVLALAVVSIGALAFASFDGNELTGASIGVSDPNTEEVSIDEKIILDEPITFVNNKEITIDDENLLPQANCAVWPCNCGDTLTASVTMTGSLSACTEDGLIIGANNIVLDCKSHNISGDRSNGYYGVKIESYGNITVKNCNLTDFYGGVGLISTSAGNRIFNSTLFNNTDYGVFVQSSNYNVIENNSITQTKADTGNTLTGIYLESADYNNLTNNTAYFCDQNGLSFSGSDYNRVVDCTFYNNGNNGMDFAGGSTNNRIVGGKSYHGILGLIFQQVSSNNIVENFNLTYNTSTNLYVISNSVNITLLNTSLNNVTVIGASSSLLVKWFLDVYVNNTENKQLTSVNVSAYNNSNNLEIKSTTNNLGFKRLELIEYWQNQTNITYHTNHTINATLDGYQNSTNINLSETNSTLINLILQIPSLNCSTVNNNINLTHNIVSNLTCFTINASNLVLDGRGARLDGNGSSVGINITSFNNITIKNFIINNYTTGLNVLSSFNNTIHTNYFTNNTLNGTVFTSSNGSVIYNNYFANNTNHSWDNENNSWNTSRSCISRQINILGGNCFGGNYWQGYLTTDSTSDGIGDISYNITGGNSKDNLPLVDGTTIKCGQVPSSLTLPSLSTLYAGNTCFTIAANNVVIDGQGATIINDGTLGTKAVYVNGYDNITIKNISFVNFSYGLYFEDNSDDRSYNNTISDISITGSNSDSYGLYFDYVIASNISKTTINFSSSGSHNSSINMFFSSNNTFDKIIIDGDNPEIAAVNIEWYSHNNTFKNSNIMSGGYDLIVGEWNQGVDTINYFINTTTNNVTSKTDSTVYIKWYVDVNVTSLTNVTIENVNISGYDVTGAIDHSVLTAANGFGRLELTEYYVENFITYITTNNHTIKTSKANYTENSTQLNLANTSSTSITLMIPDLSCGMLLSTSATLGKNLTATENGCLTINGNNITINGNGYNIIGNGSGLGINLTNKNNVNISNVIVSNFTYGIQLENSDNNTLTGVTAINNSIGIFVNTSNNNKIYDSVIDNNTANQMFLTNPGGTNTSLINISINISNVSVTGTATLFLKWYVNTNITLNSTSALQGANVTGHFNNTMVIDDTGTTDVNGSYRLELTELKKNSSGIYYLTPHLINTTYVSSTEIAYNSTQINLSLTNNTLVSLSLNLNCTIPTNDLEVSSNITLCPGTYNVADTGSTGVIIVKSSNINISCDSTIMVGSGNTEGGKAIYGKDYNNVVIEGCEFRDYGRGIHLINSNNNKLYDITTQDNWVGIDLDNVDQSTISRLNDIDSYSDALQINGNNNEISNVNFQIDDVSASVGIRLYNADSNTITNGSITSGANFGILVDNSDSNTIRNITFTDSDALTLSNSENNIIYHNNFTSSNSGDYYNVNSDKTNQLNNTVGAFIQGNEWSVYCGKGSDLDGDGYADAVSTSGGDWPHRNLTSVWRDYKFLSLSNEADYHPKIIDCAASVVQLGDSSSTSSESSSSALPSAVAESAEAQIGDYSSASGVKENLEWKTKELMFDEKITRVTVTLENKGNKRMKLFPELSQEHMDPFFIVTRKTLGAEESFSEKLSGISYSQNVIVGRLLEAEILNSEQIILEPGESIEKVLEIKEGLISPHQIKIQFTTFGEVVTEQEVEISSKAVTGTAVDIDIDNNVFDFYAVMVPEELSEEFTEYYAKEENNQITGGAITNNPYLSSNDNYYYLELNLITNDNEGHFTDLYGPYKLTSEQVFIFAQQFKYNPKDYNGHYTIEAKILKGNDVVSENEIKVKLE